MPTILSVMHAAAAELNHKPLSQRSIAAFGKIAKEVLEIERHTTSPQPRGKPKPKTQPRKMSAEEMKRAALQQEKWESNTLQPHTHVAGDQVDEKYATEIRYIARINLDGLNANEARIINDAIDSQLKRALKERQLAFQKALERPGSTLSRAAEERQAALNRALRRRSL